MSRAVKKAIEIPFKIKRYAYYSMYSLLFQDHNCIYLILSSPTDLLKALANTVDNVNKS